MILEHLFFLGTVSRAALCLRGTLSLRAWCHRARPFIARQIEAGRFDDHRVAAHYEVAGKGEEGRAGPGSTERVRGPPPPLVVCLRERDFEPDDLREIACDREVSRKKPGDRKSIANASIGRRDIKARPRCNTHGRKECLEGTRAALEKRYQGSNISCCGRVRRA